MKKILGLFIISMFLISGVSALDSLGTFKQNDFIRIAQVCSDATWINISSISTPSSAVAFYNISMNYSGNGEFFDIFNNTFEIGRYDVRGISDGCEKTFATYFDITPSGFTGTLGFYLVLILLIGAVIVMGFTIKEAWFVVMGGMALMMLGLYSINYGIVGFKDMFMVWGVGLFEIGIGFFLSVMAALEKMDA